MTTIRTLGGIAVLSLILWAGAGCYETKYPLGSADNATVDAAYVGDFTFTDKDETDQFVIRNIDGHRYYVEFSKKGGDTLRMVGYTADVKGVTIANLRGMEDDGSIPDTYMLMRVSISPDHSKLSLRNLDNKFFDGKNIDSVGKQQNLIAANLDNDQMYDAEAITATRDLAKPNGMK